MSPSAVFTVPSNFQIDRVETHTLNHRTKDYHVSYNFKLDGRDPQKLIASLDKKKSDTFYIFSGSLCALLFINLIQNSSLAGRALSFLLSTLSVTVAIGSGYQHWVHASTVDKVKLLFGTVEQQQQGLIDVASGLPPGCVKITYEPLDYTPL